MSRKSMWKQTESAGAVKERWGCCGAWTRGGSCGVGKQGKTRVRARAAAAGRRCGVSHIPTRHNINMALRHRSAHGDNFGVQCGPGVSKKANFTHVRGNLRGNVSEKRFNTHAVERNLETNCEGGHGVRAVWLGKRARQEFAHGRWQRGEGAGHATFLPGIT